MRSALASLALLAASTPMLAACQKPVTPPATTTVAMPVKPVLALDADGNELPDTKAEGAYCFDLILKDMVDTKVDGASLKKLSAWSVDRYESIDCTIGAANRGRGVTENFVQIASGDWYIDLVVMGADKAEFSISDLGPEVEYQMTFNAAGEVTYTARTGGDDEYRPTPDDVKRANEWGSFLWQQAQKIPTEYRMK